MEDTKKQQTEENSADDTHSDRRTNTGYCQNLPDYVSPWLSGRTQFQGISKDTLEEHRLRYEKEASKYVHTRPIVLRSIPAIFPEEPFPPGEYISRVKAEMEYRLERERLFELRRVPNRRMLEIYKQLNEMREKNRSEMRIAKRRSKKKTPSGGRSHGKSTRPTTPTEQKMEELMAEKRSLEFEVNKITERITALKEPYDSRYVWNRMSKLNETMDTLLRMLPPSSLPVNT